MSVDIGSDTPRNSASVPSSLPPTPRVASSSDTAAGARQVKENVPSVPTLPRYANVPGEYPALLEESLKEIALLTSTKLPKEEEGMEGSWKFLFEKKGVLAGTKAGKHLIVR